MFEDKLKGRDRDRETEKERERERGREKKYARVDGQKDYLLKCLGEEWTTSVYSFGWVEGSNPGLSLF